MALLTSLLDVRDRKEEFHTSAQRVFLDSIPPSAIRLQTLNLRGVSWRITNKSPPIGGEGITHSAPGLVGSPAAVPVGQLFILPQPQYRPLFPYQLHFIMDPSPTFRPSHATISDRFLYGGPSSPAPLQRQTSNLPLGPSESAPSSNGFETVILFGREMPSVEALYDDLIRQRSLVEVLQGRRDAGLPLQTLVFRQSQLSEESFKELEEVVSEVDWDDRNVQSWKGQLWKKAVEGNAGDNSNALDVLV
ncbi:hypothetical protein DL96DRAFT_1614093 [Flagelloscypha sp. PMI_526]|nr:hypothetical protein DL96DRAFT_1614093 [Flagelloscypha sp. PMI_526]